MELSKEAAIAQLRLDVTSHYLMDNYNTPEHANSKIPARATEMKARLDKAFEAMGAASRR